jgi:hypothetical protein
MSWSGYHIESDPEEPPIDWREARPFQKRRRTRISRSRRQSVVSFPLDDEYNDRYEAEELQRAIESEAHRKANRWISDEEVKQRLHFDYVDRLGLTPVQADLVVYGKR